MYRIGDKDNIGHVLISLHISSVGLFVVVVVVIVLLCGVLSQL